jgi:hypothetical protein
MSEKSNDFLEEITLRLPGSDDHLIGEILAQLGNVGSKADGKLRLDRSNSDFYPIINVDTNSDNKRVSVEFLTSEGCSREIVIENTTGMTKKSPLEYSHLTVDEIGRRFNGDEIVIDGLDHVGFDLPWFSSGVHPQIENLRRDFSSKCLYHRFPTGEPWDFIVPGSINEILMLDEVDYSSTRKPKFEIVSFDISSTPLIQFDVECNKKYEVLCRVFPEAIHDSQLRNIWTYIENPYSVDICFVLNETSNSDWSLFFKNSRIFP